MSSLLIAAIAVAALGLGYVIYGRLVRKWLGLDPDMTPPSVALYDSVDYVPAKHWTVLFGHHFASIAGAGPIMGPVIACLFWGWAPALLWVVVGGILPGGSARLLRPGGVGGEQGAFGERPQRIGAW